MNEMAFHIQGIGYGGASGGSAFLAFKYNGLPLLYSAWCQGTAGSKVYTKKPFDIKNELDTGEEVLFNFIGSYVVTIDIPDAYVGWGTVSFSMKIEEQETGKARYEVKRKPDVRGVSTGKIVITTKFNKHDLSDTGDALLWKGIWNGELRPNMPSPF